MYIYHIFLIQSSVEGHLGCFHVLVIVNSAARNIVEGGASTPLNHYFVQVYSMSGIAGSYGSSVFSFLRYLHTVFHSGCAGAWAYQTQLRIDLQGDPAE